MYRKISSDVIIGNYLIEALTHDVHELSFSDLIDFEANLNVSLGEMDYYSDIFFEDIYETVSRFGCFCITDSSISIDISESQKTKLIDKLIEFFRYGLPHAISTIIQSACSARFALA